MAVNKKEPTQLEFNDWLEADGYLNAQLVSKKCLCGALLDKKKVEGHDHSRCCYQYKQRPIEQNSKQKGK